MAFDMRVCCPVSLGGKQIIAPAQIDDVPPRPAPYLSNEFVADQVWMDDRKCSSIRR
jgi:hypothetical protein